MMQNTTTPTDFATFRSRAEEEVPTLAGKRTKCIKKAKQKEAEIDG